MLYRNYTEQKIDPDLVSGLLSALNNFSETELQSHGISMIVMAGLEWTYYRPTDVPLMLIAADVNSSNSDLMQSRLHIIYDMFKAQFNLTAEQMNNPLIDVSEFEVFTQILDALKSQWSIADNQLGVAALFDVLGIFHQLLNMVHEIFKSNVFGKESQKISVRNYKKFQDILLNYRGRIDSDKEWVEYEKIVLDRDGGWSVININPNLVKPDVFFDLMFEILDFYVKAIQENIPKMTLLYAYNKKVYPYVINQYSLLHKLGLLEKLLKIFLLW